jgi:Zn-dependent protease
MDTVIVNTFAALMNYHEVRTYIVMFVGLLIAIGLHEYGHAAMAVWLGDPTPKNPRQVMSALDPLGRLMGVGRGRTNRYTMNPLAHADPIGTIALPITATFLLPGAGLIGWGRPVPFNPHARGRKVSLQRMIVLVSLSGPISNLIQALAWSVLLALALLLGAGQSDLEVVRALVSGAPYMPPQIGWLHMLVALNFILAVFNLLPVPPLDGGHLLTTWLERTHRDWAAWLERYGLFVFLLLFPLLPYILRPFYTLGLRWSLFVAALAGG